MSALIKQKGHYNQYTLDSEETDVWVQLGGIYNVNIVRHQGSVEVMIWALKDGEDFTGNAVPLASTLVTDEWVAARIKSIEEED